MPFTQTFFSTETTATPKAWLTQPCSASMHGRMSAPLPPCKPSDGVPGFALQGHNRPVSPVPYSCVLNSRQSSSLIPPPASSAPPCASSAAPSSASPPISPSCAAIFAMVWRKARLRNSRNCTMTRCRQSAGATRHMLVCTAVLDGKRVGA